LLEGKKGIRNTIVFETVKKFDLPRMVPDEEYRARSGRP
jgi:hypothetical protein